MCVDYNVTISFQHEIIKHELLNFVLYGLNQHVVKTCALYCVFF